MICPNCKVDVKVNYKNYGRNLGLAKYNALVIEIGDVSGRLEKLEKELMKFVFF